MVLVNKGEDFDSNNFFLRSLSFYINTGSILNAINMKLTLQLFILILIFGFYNEGFAQVRKDSLRILFVGNSYTSVPNIPFLVSLMSDSTKVKLVTSRSTIGGATLSNHWNGEKELKTREDICNGIYDIVVIQGHSMETIENKSDFLKYSKLLCNLVKESGAKPYLYVTWARQNFPQYQDTITGVYIEAAKENDCGLVMVGESWKLARAIRPDIDLYMPDGSHQNDLGAFLTACIFVDKFTGEVPTKLSTSYLLKNAKDEEVLLFLGNAADIELCQKVALEFLD